MAPNKNPRKSREGWNPRGNDGFLCAACGMAVVQSAVGTRNRNHCPHCLCSLHVDITPGDRLSLCCGVMNPISCWIKENGEIALIHRCSRCGTIKSNRIAGDDNADSLKQLLHCLAKAVSA